MQRKRSALILNSSLHLPEEYNLLQQSPFIYFSLSPNLNSPQRSALRGRPWVSLAFLMEDYLRPGGTQKAKWLNRWLT
jgi:hypothetical protein